MFQRGARVVLSTGAEADAAWGQFSNGQVAVYDTSLDQIRGANNPFPGTWVSEDQPSWNGTNFVPRQYSPRTIWAGNQTSTSTTFANITALTVPIKAAGVWTFDAYLLYSSSATTEGSGWQVAYTGTVGGGLQYQVAQMTDATTSVALQTYGTFGSNPASQTAGPGAAVARVVISGGFVSSGAGTLSVQFKTETGGANSTTVSIGSRLLVQEA